MKTYPDSYKERNEINLRHGIKSSLGEIKELFALVYTLYLSDNKNSSIAYSKEVNAPNTQIEIQDALLASVKNLFGALVVNDANFKNAINSNPLFKSQIESLQVTLELFWKLAKVTFINNPGENTRERTGGKRFNKQIDFSTNLILLDNVLSERDSSISPELKELLYNWILKTPNYVPDVNLYNKIQTTLTIFSEETQFKIRKDDNTELYFQQEGIYDELIKGNTVNDRDNVEPVGPFRILKSFVKSGLHRFIKEDGNNGFSIKNPADLVELQNYDKTVETSLNLIPKRTVIYQTEEGNNQADDVENPQNLDNIPHQIIFYGSPGTGKSHKVDKIIENLDKRFFERVTFHPEYDNSSFIGGYKPISEKVKYTNEEGEYFVNEVHYKFVPQAFTNIYERAWQDLDNQYYLVIEEINRGNCAEIFGEIFQLLDRTSNYTVSPSKELKEYLSYDAFKDENHAGIVKGLKLPPNLSILATMNTSDQSLFPMDSAFKRRWDWEYVPICYDAIDELGKNNDSFDFEIDIEDGNKYSWIKFIEKINLNHIKNNPSLGMDKCIGNYFIKPEKNNTIELKPFINKVIFYLWNDVFKDEDNNVFEQNTSYEDFFPMSTNGKEKIKVLFERIDLTPKQPKIYAKEEPQLAQVAEPQQEME